MSVRSCLLNLGDPYDIMALLIKNGIDIYVDNDEALRLAIKYWHYDVIDY